MPERFQIGKLAILGPGLIGGSLLWASRRSRHDAAGSWQVAREVSVYDTCEKTRAAIFRSGLIGVTVCTSAEEAVRGADLVVIAVPVDHMKAVAEEALPGFRPETIVTDVGSVKGRVIAELEPLLKGRARWVAGHPMAGREKSGFDENEASAGLFEGATVIVTPTGETDPEALAVVESFWRAVGGRVLRMTPQDHDHRTARISHLPHLAAAALATLASDESLEVAGPGFRDTTRVAAGSAPMWKEILLANRVELGAVLDELIAGLQETRRALDQGDGPALLEFLHRANAVRDRLEAIQPKTDRRQSTV